MNREPQEPGGRAPDVIDRLVIFGGTGDLTGRYVLPGLAALLDGGHLSEGFELTAASREDWDDGVNGSRVSPHRVSRQAHHVARSVLQSGRDAISPRPARRRSCRCAGRGSC
jgi:glucose-6-phosphate 1-dehydrogenase